MSLIHFRCLCQWWMILPHLFIYYYLFWLMVQLDDALSAMRLQDGRIRVWIHVADPTCLVKRHSIIDRLFVFQPWNFVSYIDLWCCLKNLCFFYLGKQCAEEHPFSCPLLHFQCSLKSLPWSLWACSRETFARPSVFVLPCTMMAGNLHIYYPIHTLK